MEHPAELHEKDVVVYENGTQLSLDEYKAVLKGATAQQSKALDFFRTNKDRWYTAEEVHSLCMPDQKLGSIRRAISTLLKQGYVIKLGEKYKKPGSNGVRLVSYLFNQNKFNEEN